MVPVKIGKALSFSRALSLKEKCVLRSTIRTKQVMYRGLFSPLKLYSGSSLNDAKFSLGSRKEQRGQQSKIVVACGAHRKDKLTKTKVPL